MNNNKKNIIINEIHNWKNNKLLPETYCDFLLALYTEGNQNDIEITSQKEQKRKAITVFQVFLYGWLLMLLPAMLLVIYFTELSFILQMTIVAFFLVSSLVVTAYFIRKRAFFQVPLSITFIQLLIVSLSIIEKITNGDRLWIGGAVVVNCLLWILVGRKYQVIYLQISGSVGLIIFILTIMVF
jgi:hypothetical protein